MVEITRAEPGIANSCTLYNLSNPESSKPDARMRLTKRAPAHAYGTVASVCAGKAHKPPPFLPAGQEIAHEKRRRAYLLLMVIAAARCRSKWVSKGKIA
jgi:hypothetical protein